MCMFYACIFSSLYEICITLMIVYNNHFSIVRIKIRATINYYLTALQVKAIVQV